MIDSGDWPTPLSEHMREEFAEIAQYDIQSPNALDIIDQKWVYIKAFTQPSEYRKDFFAFGLLSPSLTIQGNTPECMRYLRTGANADVTPHTGIWRQWDPAKPKSRAKELYERMYPKDATSMDATSKDATPKDATSKEIERVRQNVENPLDQRQEGKPDPLQETLEETIKRNKAEAEGQRPIGAGETGAASSTEVPKQQRSPSKGDPANAKQIMENAQANWTTNTLRMTKQSGDEISRMFCNIQGTNHFMLDKVLEGLEIKEEDYSPKLPYRPDGYLKYDKVPAYNRRWLPKDKTGNPNPEEFRESFDPSKVWIEDRWMVCRRLCGDKLCRILFYKTCTFIWEHNNLERIDVRERQDALLKYVFRVDSLAHFRTSLEDNEVRVISWDATKFIWMTKDSVHKMFLEVCMMGPMVAMFGREFQQYLLENPGKQRIPKETMQYSVDSGRTSMGNKRLEMTHTQYVADEFDDDCISISSKRTRSPRRDMHHNAPWNQSPSNRGQDVDMIFIQRSDGRPMRDIRGDDLYRDDLSRPVGADPRIRGHYPREERQRDDMPRRGDYPRSQTRHLEPRYYEHKPKERKPQRHESEPGRRSDRRD